MNRSFLLSGLVVLSFGLLFCYLLFELQFETFREDLEPWRLIAISLAVLGGMATLGGIVLPKSLTMALRSK